MTLQEYIRSTIDLPWQWGVQDCTIWVADWCIQHWGIDPASRFRSSYATEADAETLITGGLIELVAPEIPLPRKNIPDEGDIGVIHIAGRQVAAIYTGAHWVFRKPGGIGMASRPSLAIWGD